MFIEKIYGQPLDKIQDRSSATDPESNQHQIGEITASTHSIRSKNFGYFGNGTEHGSATWGEAFSNFVETILNDGESLGVTFPFSYKNIRKIFNRHALLLNEVKHLVLVHWDLWPGNIFIIEKHEEFKVEGIIDWERAYWGDSESESAIATNFYSPTFFQGYGRPLPKGRNTAIRHKMYQIYWL